MKTDLKQLIASKRFIPILSDYGFKITFANEKNTLFLRTAIQALIQSPVPIEQITFIRNEVSGVSKESRGGLYDLICKDANQTTFIVEMQLGHFKHFVQRSKFYAFHQFNTLVRKGKYKYENLSKIYSIGFLAKNIFKDPNYYHFAQLKNQRGVVIDDQMFHIIVEIGKFEKKAQDCTNHLDQLIYTMKHLNFYELNDHFPAFWTDEWLELAIKELDKRGYPPERVSQIEIALAKEASYAQMLEDEREEGVQEGIAMGIQVAREEANKEKHILRQRIEEERKKAEEERQKAEKAEEERQRAEEERQKAEGEKQIAITNLLGLGMLSDEQIAEIMQVSLDFVLKIKNES